jgi:hypothetical protein
VRKDYRDDRTGTFDNTPGNIVEMDRKDVTVDRHETCSSGLHVGAIAYLSSMYGGGTWLEVLVDPSDVVSVPFDYNNQKMRVCRYKVIREITGRTQEAVEKESSLYEGYAEPIEDTSVELKKTVNKVLDTMSKITGKKPIQKRLEKFVKNGCKQTKKDLLEDIGWEVSRVGEGRLPLSGKILSKLGLLPGMSIGITYENKTLVVRKADRFSEFELKILSDGSVRLSKTLVDKICKKSNKFIIKICEDNKKMSLRVAKA